jgi:hypothetical protein
VLPQATSEPAGPHEQDDVPVTRRDIRAAAIRVRLGAEGRLWIDLTVGDSMRAAQHGILSAVAGTLKLAALFGYRRRLVRSRPHEVRP